MKRKKDNLPATVGRLQHLLSITNQTMQGINKETGDIVIYNKKSIFGLGPGTELQNPLGFQVRRAIEVFLIC